MIVSFSTSFLKLHNQLTFKWPKFWEAYNEAAVQFLDYAKLRSIYFENKFTHKTFYEYFISNYIFSNFYSTPGGYDKFLEILHSSVGQSAWSVILELLICQVDSKQIEFKVIDDLIDVIIENKSYDGCLLFLGVMPHLKTLSPSRTKKVISMTLGHLVETNVNEPKTRNLVEKLINLLRVEKFVDHFCQLVRNRIENQSLYELVLELNGHVQNNKVENLLEEFQNLYYDSEKKYIIQNYSKLIDRNNIIKIFKDFVQKFGTDKALLIYNSKFGINCFGEKQSFSWILQILRGIRNRNDILDFEQLILDMGFSLDRLEKHIIEASGKIKGDLTFLVVASRQLSKHSKVFGKMILNIIQQVAGENIRIIIENGDIIHYIDDEL